MLATKTQIRSSAPSGDWSLDRTWLDDFAARLSWIDVVSFDVFDTTISLRCDAPVGAFALAEERLIVKAGEDVSEFAVARELAEQDARKAVKALSWDEVTLAEVYVAIPQRLPGRGALSGATEVSRIEAEADLLFRAPEIIEAVRRAQCPSRRRCTERSAGGNSSHHPPKKRMVGGGEQLGSASGRLCAGGGA